MIFLSSIKKWKILCLYKMLLIFFKLFFKIIVIQKLNIKHFMIYYSKEAHIMMLILSPKLYLKNYLFKNNLLYNYKIFFNFVKKIWNFVPLLLNYTIMNPKNNDYLY
jgi:hypothetical protein